MSKSKQSQKKINFGSLSEPNDSKMKLGMGACNITLATSHFRIVLKPHNLQTRDARDEERVRAFGAVVAASCESLITSAIVCFSSIGNLVVKSRVEMIVVYSAVDDDHSRVWCVTACLSW